jgi:hypothetical protein
LATASCCKAGGRVVVQGGVVCVEPFFFLKRSAQSRGHGSEQSTSSHVLPTFASCTLIEFVATSQRARRVAAALYILAIVGASVPCPHRLACRPSVRDNLACEKCCRPVVATARVPCGAGAASWSSFFRDAGYGVRRLRFASNWTYSIRLAIGWETILLNWRTRLGCKS